MEVRLACERKNKGEEGLGEGINMDIRGIFALMNYGHKATPESHEKGKGGNGRSEGRVRHRIPRMWGDHFVEVY